MKPRCLLYPTGLGLNINPKVDWTHQLNQHKWAGESSWNVIKWGATCLAAVLLILFVRTVRQAFLSPKKSGHASFFRVLHQDIQTPLYFYGQSSGHSSFHTNKILGHNLFEDERPKVWKAWKVRAEGEFPALWCNVIISVYHWTGHVCGWPNEAEFSRILSSSNGVISHNAMSTRQGRISPLILPLMYIVSTPPVHY